MRVRDLLMSVPRDELWAQYWHQEQSTLRYHKVTEAAGEEVKERIKKSFDAAMTEIQSIAKQVESHLHQNRASLFVHRRSEYDRLAGLYDEFDVYAWQNETKQAERLFLTDWAEMLSMEIEAVCLERYGESVTAAAVLQEMTRYGYTEQQRQAYKDDLCRKLEVGRMKTERGEGIPAEEAFASLREKWSSKQPSSNEEQETARKAHEADERSKKEWAFLMKSIQEYAAEDDSPF